MAKIPDAESVAIALTSIDEEMRVIDALATSIHLLMSNVAVMQSAIDDSRNRLIKARSTLTEYKHVTVARAS